MSRRVHSGSVGPLAMILAVLVGLTLPLAMPAEAQRPAEQAEQTEQPRPQTVIGPASGDELHVMSYNLRFAADREPHSWPARRPVLAELLRREAPTVLGTQEGLYGQLKDVEADLPEHYDWIGVGRDGGSRGEFMAVFYDTRRLVPLEFDHFWLSDTPDVVGSKNWGNRIVRMVTWVRFRDARTGKELVVVNTHFDDKSELARQRAADMVRDRIESFAPGLPVVLTGDFNARADTSVTYAMLTSGMADAWNTAAQRRTEAYATWHGYGPLRPNGKRIDWILTKGAVTVHAVGVNTFSRGGQFPSDHLPVQALLSLD